MQRSCQHDLPGRPLLVWALRGRRKSRAYNVGKRVRLARFGQAPHQRPVAFRRAGDKAAAMEIEQHPARHGSGRADPFAGNGAELAGFKAQLRGGRAEALEQGVEMRPYLRDIADTAGGFAGLSP